MIDLEEGTGRGGGGLVELRARRANELMRGEGFWQRGGQALGGVKRTSEGRQAPHDWKLSELNSKNLQML